MIVKDAYIAGTADASTFWHYGNFYTRAMTFTAGAYYVLTRVSLKLYVSSNVGTDNPVITVKLYSTSGGAPSAELAATTTTRHVNELTTNTAGEWYDFDFSGYSLSSGTVYAIYVQIVFDYASKYVYWKGVSSGNPYGGGCGYEFHDNYPTGWYESANADYDFKIWANSNIYLHSATGSRRYKTADFTGFSFPNPAGSGFTSANDGYALQAGLSADPLLTV
ncbi:MAG: hypothetical protein PHQ43_12420, partial [Dehalococcoidales bacterium]|nr:hypothetical protein [Dehalococcoidales bacterium]